ncbi:MAG: Asp-tRNA(Asn)/Glu-tRNA(Gln) amidotransferase subunit GatC [Patescibacteria group bacterium]|nr:Asp-tRNA(Asn)/Glu-tRNA(Gln) amidotransferase subunit GatC [Patescibacteria group bacterium]
MAKLSQKEVEKIAQLARIKLTESETEKFPLELSEILNYVEKINEIHKQNIPETSQVTGLENVFRKDEAMMRSEKQAIKNRDELLSNAPDKKDGYIKVKAVLE